MPETFPAEYYALVDDKTLPTPAAWSEALAAAGLPVVIDPGFDPANEAADTLRVTVAGRATACDFGWIEDDLGEGLQPFDELAGKIGSVAADFTAREHDADSATAALAAAYGLMRLTGCALFDYANQQPLVAEAAVLSLLKARLGPA